MNDIDKRKNLLGLMHLALHECYEERMATDEFVETMMNMIEMLKELKTKKED